jgi:hypothetical protein
VYRVYVYLLLFVFKCAYVHYICPCMCVCAYVLVMYWCVCYVCTYVRRCINVFTYVHVFLCRDGWCVYTSICMNVCTRTVCGWVCKDCYVYVRLRMYIFSLFVCMFYLHCVRVYGNIGYVNYVPILYVCMYDRYICLRTCVCTYVYCMYPFWTYTYVECVFCVCDYVHVFLLCKVITCVHLRISADVRVKLLICAYVLNIPMCVCAYVYLCMCDVCYLCTAVRMYVCVLS